MARAKRSTRAKLASSKQSGRFEPHPDGRSNRPFGRGLALKPDPHPSPSTDPNACRASLDSATTGDEHLAGDTSTVRSYVPSSPGASEGENGRKIATRREACLGASAPRKRYLRLNKTQLDVLYPPKNRASIHVLYRWMAELSPRERVRRAPYCFRDSDGLPRAHFKREFQAYEARQIQAGRLNSPPDQRVQRSPSELTGQRPRTPCSPVDGLRSYTPSNAPVILQKWKGKSREPREDSGRIQMLEERIKFMEVATQHALNEVARRQDGSIDKRIRWAVGPLHEEQRRLNDAVGPLGDQMQKLATAVSRQMEELKNAVLSSRRLESAGGFT
ncbi:hypothetical protein SLS58_009943 [Diplodia intermedia]|uniref:Uncharacterized protein n=1 Tax=Diplodia intermedia TaxID=856260 RepID=A0ABR3T9F1_9PEZI